MSFNDKFNLHMGRSNFQIGYLKIADISYRERCELCGTDKRNQYRLLKLYSQLNFFYISLQCRLIVSTMSHQKCEIFNYMFIPLVFIDIAIFLVSFNEVYVLAAYTLIIGCAHVDYGVGVVSISLAKTVTVLHHMLKFCQNACRQLK